ncbi:hypothetical protein NUW54_g10080 [Trametes sanguinea]|uniref:Uncharacterized protein n=1 Tax=Trametes sanguinea TaxID=158606 RepID=A0ACC1P4N4_9APHY|nr:hypothetical protein NUW54_g10080 [Trametes sanguinea]
MHGFNTITAVFLTALSRSTGQSVAIGQGRRKGGADCRGLCEAGEWEVEYKEINGRCARFSSGGFLLFPSQPLYGSGCQDDVHFYHHARCLLLRVLHLGLGLLERVAAFDLSRKDNLAVYWGQDSAGNQQRLSHYCKDSTVDTFPIAFLYIFRGAGGEPVIDFANTCNQWDQGTFSGTDLANCTIMAADIKECQAAGKLITLSLGGATGEVGFSSDSQASSFADQVWNLFLGGESDIRPFGDAVLDGCAWTRPCVQIHCSALVGNAMSFSDWSSVSPSSSSDDELFDGNEGYSFVISRHSKREYLLAQIRQKNAIIESLLKQVRLARAGPTGLFAMPVERADHAMR